MSSKRPPRLLRDEETFDSQGVKGPMQAHTADEDEGFKGPHVIVSSVPIEHAKALRSVIGYMKVPVLRRAWW